MTNPLDIAAWQNQQMLCLVTKPDSVVIEVEVDRNAVGQEVLDMVCAAVGTVEKDYFGLQYYNIKRERQWLNLRNRVNIQLPPSCQTPCRFKLRIKYFIETSYLQQDSTRRLFYIQLKQNFLEGKLRASVEKTSHLVALIAQIETGDITSSYDKLGRCNFYSAFCPSSENDNHGSDTNINSIIEQHSRLQGCTSSSCLSKFLSIVSSLPDYGVETYQVKFDTSAVVSPSLPGRNLQTPPNKLVDVDLQIGPHGIRVLDEEDTYSFKVPFRALQQATHSGKQIDLHVYQDNGSIKSMPFRTPSDGHSNALYRIITERLAFYTWDTIHSSVIHQHSLDFKGHFIALFRPNNIPDAGKQYLFDVQRTWKEAYDNVRRILYRKQQQMIEQENKKKAQVTSSLPPLNNPTSNKNTANSDSVAVEHLQDRLQVISNALTCQVCCDQPLEVAFIPCGHQVCCKECAKRCSTCPICRQEISSRLTVFLPIGRDYVLKGDHCDDDAVDTSSSDSVMTSSNNNLISSSDSSLHQQLSQLQVHETQVR